MKILLEKLPVHAIFPTIGLAKSSFRFSETSYGKTQTFDQPNIA